MSTTVLNGCGSLISSLTTSSNTLTSILASSSSRSYRDPICSNISPLPLISSSHRLIRTAPVLATSSTLTTAVEMTSVERLKSGFEQFKKEVYECLFASLECPMAPNRWLRPEVYPLFAAVGTVVGICVMQLMRNITSNPDVRVLKEKRAAGVLDNLAEGEKYREHGLRKYVRNRVPEIMPSVNGFFSKPDQ